MVVVICGILLSSAIPSFSGLLNARREANVVTSFMASLNMARSEAIKRNGRAVMCKSQTGWSCVTAGGWEQGWIIFHDLNNNAVFDSGELLILQFGGIPGGLRLTGNLQVANYVSYGASGSAKLTSGAFQAGTFTLCPKDVVGAVRQIILSGSGRPRDHKGTASDCS